MTTLATIDYLLGSTPTHSVICLHGLGANNNDLKPIAQTLALPNVHFIFPQAPRIPITLYEGAIVPGWYDVRNRNFDTARSNIEQVDATCTEIKALIANEQAQYGIDSTRIFLMGFSQGGSIALELGLHSEQTYAGIVGLSTLPAKREQTFDHLSLANQKTPIFLAHGTQDPVVPFSIGEFIHQSLIKQHYAVEWHVAETLHTIWPEEINALRQWMLNIIVTTLAA